MTRGYFKLMSPQRSRRQFAFFGGKSDRDAAYTSLLAQLEPGERIAVWGCAYPDCMRLDQWDSETLRAMDRHWDETKGAA